MSFKSILILTIVAVTNATILHNNVLPAATLVHGVPVAVAAEEIDPHPQYNFAYDVRDALSGDAKSQSETRDGDVVRGHYSIIDADGLQRTVEYTADPVNGFNAVVSRTPVVSAVVGIPARRVAVASEPAIVKTSFSSPIVSYAH